MKFCGSRLSPEGQVTTLIANSNNPAKNAYAPLYPQAIHTLDALSKDSAETISFVTITNSKVYVLGEQLYVLDLLSDDWKILINQTQLKAYTQTESDTGNQAAITALESDRQGNLYLLLSSAESPDTNRKKILRITPPAHK